MSIEDQGPREFSSQVKNGLCWVKGCSFKIIRWSFHKNYCNRSRRVDLRNFVWCLSQIQLISCWCRVWIISNSFRQSSDCISSRKLIIVLNKYQDSVSQKLLESHHEIGCESGIIRWLWVLLWTSVMDTIFVEVHQNTEAKFKKFSSLNSSWIVIISPRRETLSIRSFLDG